MCIVCVITWVHCLTTAWVWSARRQARPGNGELSCLLGHEHHPDIVMDAQLCPIGINRFLIPVGEGQTVCVLSLIGQESPRAELVLTLSGIGPGRPPVYLRGSITNSKGHRCQEE
jgi:hypothetical protein